VPAQVYIDGVEIVPPIGEGTSAISGSSTRRLNRPSSATITVPNHLAIGGAGSKLKIVINGTLHHHGFVQLVETNPQEDTGYTVYNSEDPLELWKWRPCRDYGGTTPGNFVNPSFLRRNYPDPTPGPQIIQEIIDASEYPGGIPETAEGPLFLESGFFAVGGPDLSGAPATFPITMSDMLSMLTSTGVMDVVITPIDAFGNMGKIDVYNSYDQWWTDRRGSLIFEYGMGARNIRDIRWTEDLSGVSNKIQYFFGPKETVQRYKGNITGDDPCLDIQLGTAAIDALQAKRLASRNQYGVRMELQEFEVEELAVEQDPPSSGNCVFLDKTRSLYRQLWFWESNIRANPRKLYHITPIRGFAINAFNLGDIVTVRCTPAIRGGFSGIQRIYEYTVSWDNQGVLEINNLVTSPDQEGF
jgi:hypothetical protein